MIDNHDGDDDHHDDYDHDNFQETQKSSVEDNIQMVEVRQSFRQGSHFYVR